jgi:hypothetical protein
MQWAETMLAATTRMFAQVYQGGIDCQNRGAARQSVTVLPPRSRVITGRVSLSSQTGKVYVTVAVNHSWKITCVRSRRLFDKADTKVCHD